MPSPLSLYVHWPFCVAKCPYCDFNSHAAQNVDQAVWRDGLVSEVKHWGRTLGPRTVKTVFFGGGTPSLMDAKTVGTILNSIDKTWGLDPSAEVTLEANPSSVEADRFVDYRGAGVNRVSIGVQALDDRSLAQLGRVHDVAEAKAALATAAQVFDRFSFDLIYARVGQDVDAWQKELSEALKLANGHISLYQLTIEPGTAFFRDGVASAEEAVGVEMFELTQNMTADAGLPAYEISNHARPGAESRHNLVYWRGGEYAGVGPGAHGRVLLDGTWHAAHQITTPERWRQAVESKGHATAKSTPLSTVERAEERVMTGLRLTSGLDRNALKDLSGVINPQGFADLIDSGDLVQDTAGLRTTLEGRLRLNGVIERLLV